MYKTIVEGTDETFSEATDNFVRLRLLEKIDEEELSLENLKENVNSITDFMSLLFLFSNPISLDNLATCTSSGICSSDFGIKFQQPKSTTDFLIIQRRYMFILFIAPFFLGLGRR